MAQRAERQWAERRRLMAQRFGLGQRGWGQHVRVGSGGWSSTRGAARGAGAAAYGCIRFLRSILLGAGGQWRQCDGSRCDGTAVVEAAA